MSYLASELESVTWEDSTAVVDNLRAERMRRLQGLLELIGIGLADQAVRQVTVPRAPRGFHIFEVGEGENLTYIGMHRKGKATGRHSHVELWEQPEDLMAVPDPMDTFAVNGDVHGEVTDTNGHTYDVKLGVGEEVLRVCELYFDRLDSLASAEATRAA